MFCVDDVLIYEVDDIFFFLVRIKMRSDDMVDFMWVYLNKDKE